jgi:DNA-binding GntR family transcriptional regulator
LAHAATGLDEDQEMLMESVQKRSVQKRAEAALPLRPVTEAGSVRIRTARTGASEMLRVLRDRITSHELPPGTKLIEQDLAATFSVSRARVRDAFAVLEQRGLIERIPNRGAIVARLTAKQVIDLYETREVLEGLAVRLSAQNTKRDHWDDLIVAFDSPAEQAIKNGDFEEYATILNLFRREVIATCNNLLLASLLDSMLERTAVVVRRMIMVPGRALEGLNDHRAVLAAMKAGKADEAERLKRSNIRAARHVFERYQQFVL